MGNQDAPEDTENGWKHQAAAATTIINNDIGGSTPATDNGSGDVAAMEAQNRKAAAATTIINNDQAGSKHAAAGERPGAFPVQARAGGGTPSWGRQMRQSVRNMRTSSSRNDLPPEMRGVVEESSVPPELRGLALRESDEDFISAEVRQSVVAEQAKPRRKRLLYYAGALLLLVGAAVGIAVGVSSSKGGDSTSPSQSEAEKASSPGPAAAPVPSFVTSCQGFEYIDPVISNLSVATFARYSNLLENLVQDLIPGYSEPENSSCEPVHLALVWLANDDSVFSSIALRNRFTLAVLFVGFRGYEWNGKKLNPDNRWMGSYSHCQWHGVICDDEGKIIELELIEIVVIEAPIPEEIGLLTDLRK
jgi:hypothetical protein